MDARFSSLLPRPFVLPFSVLCESARIDTLLYYGEFIGRIKWHFFHFYTSIKLIEWKYMSIIA